MVEDPARFGADARERLVDPASVLVLFSARAWEIAIKHALGLLPRDPFDRLLVAQARREQIPIMTADVQIRRYDVETVAAT